MTPANSGLTAILCCVFVGISGCGQSDTASPLTSDNDALLNELLGSSEPESTHGGSQSTTVAESKSKSVALKGQVASTEDDTSESIVDDILGSRDHAESVTTALTTRTSLAQPVTATSVPSTHLVQLNVGDQFPFLKAIRQTVVQTTTDRSSVRQSILNAETQMQLTINLSVVGSSNAGIEFSVGYLRVQYFQEIDGQRHNYDSSTAHTTAVPVGLEPYSGMIGNGFRFTLTPQNQIAGVNGLGDFLDKCVAASPFDQRVPVRAALEERFRNGALSELVDESIGLLPYGSSKPQEGDVWMTTRELKQQSPISLQTTCRLVSLSGTTAEVGLTGRFESPTANGALSISDGRTMGTCFVDLASGMPVHSQRTSYLKVSSERSTGLVEITKKIESTFTSQNEAARLLVLQQRAKAASAAMPSALESTVTPFQLETRSAALPQGLIGNQAAGSSLNAMPGVIGRGYGSPSNVQPFNTGQGFPVQPVSSSNAGGGSTSAAPLQIPGGVSTDQLQSTTEAVYPD